MNNLYVRVPILKELNIYNVYEHTPLNPYKYGEYPRFIRPIRDEREYKVTMPRKNSMKSLGTNE